MQINAKEMMNKVRSIVAGMGLPASEFDDAVGDGLLAAVHYAQRFDPERDTQVWTYLGKCVRLEIRNNLAKRMRWEPAVEDDVLDVDNSDAALTLANVIAAAAGSTKTGVPRMRIVEALALEGGNKEAASRMVGVSVPTICALQQELRRAV